MFVLFNVLDKHILCHNFQFCEQGLENDKTE
jgi:hypothetical protein